MLKTFKERGTGILETIPGAAGGVRFIPEIPYEEAEQLIMDVIVCQNKIAYYLGLCLSFRFTWGTEFIKTSGPDYCF